MGTFFLNIIGGCCILFCIFKIYLTISRPSAINKLALRTEDRFNNLLSKYQDDIDYWVQCFEEKRARLLSENELKKTINDAKSSKEKEEKIFHKYKKLRERYITDYLKLTEVIAASNRYLDLKENQMLNASMVWRLLEYDVKSVADKENEARDFFVLLEEAERKLDELLAET